MEQNNSNTSQKNINQGKKSQNQVQQQNQKRNQQSFYQLRFIQQQQECNQQQRESMSQQQKQNQNQNQQNEKQEDQSKMRDEQRLNQQQSMEMSSRIQNNIKNQNSNPLNIQKLPACNCKKSKCLKMYCDCYAKGVSCKDLCKCTGCQNTKNLIRQKKPESRNDQEIQRSQDSNKKSLKLKERSCNCKKSFCLKKYCQCFNAGQACAQSCKCQDCKNNGQNFGFRNEKPNGNGNACDLSHFPTLTKQVSEAFSQINRINDRKEEQNLIKKREKPDQDQIQTKLSQILKLVPQQNYQTMLDFLAYCLS